ncbi:MAG TPA: hypothetical protein EYN06_07130 [Myxococcales bacterium]|nr:hypothetical protein [Myxococcales bacterium]
MWSFMWNLNLALFILAFSLGCTSGGVGGSGKGGKVPGNDAGTNFPDSQDPANSGEYKLDFSSIAGDDGQPCKGTLHCTYNMNFLGQRDLEVVVTRFGQPVADMTVTWTVTKNVVDSLELSTAQSFTGDNGVTSVTAQQITQQSGSYEIKGELNSLSVVQPIYFTLNVDTKSGVPLTIHYNYKGQRSFQGVTTYLYLQTEEEPHSCADVDPLKILGAMTKAGPKPISQSTQFSKIPGLTDEGVLRLTVVGVGSDVNKPPVVYGCDDQNAKVTLQSSTTISIELQDIPPKWKGLYDVTTELDLVSALPDNVEAVTKTILGFFQDPAGQLLVLACELGGQQPVLKDMCTLAFANPSDPCLEDKCFSGIGLAVKGIIDGVLSDLLKDNLGGDIFFTGQDIADILTKLELKATFEFINEPMPDGSFTEFDTHEDWHTVVYRWTLGSGCDPTDEECGKYSFSFYAWNEGATVESNFAGHVDYSTGKYMLTIDPHSLDIKYGKLMFYIIEKEILPRIAGDGSDGLPKVDSFEKFIKSLMGGKECLFDNSCCEEFAKNVSGSATGAFTAGLAKTACELLSEIGSQALEGFLSDLDTDTGDAFTIGTLLPCQCFDHNANMAIDAWGSKPEPCHWNATIKVPGYETPVANKFWAIELE